MFEVAIDLDGFRTHVGRTQDTLELGLRTIAAMAAVEGSQEARSSGRFKDRTGRLRAGIAARLIQVSARNVQWEMVSAAPYSAFVEHGTRPHPIWPKAGYNLKGPLRDGQSRRAAGKGPHEHIVGRGQFLRWKGAGGEVYFARMVNHPGTAPMPFMGPGYLKAERVAQRETELLFQRIERIWN